MSNNITLADHIVFRELPFCGVLLDTTDFRVYRLSQPAARALRTVLQSSDTASPYQPLIPTNELSNDETFAQQLINMLTSRGMVRPANKHTAKMPATRRPA